MALLGIVFAWIALVGASVVRARSDMFMTKQFSAEVRTAEELEEAVRKRVKHVVIREHLDLRPIEAIATRNGDVKLTITEDTLSIVVRPVRPCTSRSELLIRDRVTSFTVPR